MNASLISKPVKQMHARIEKIGVEEAVTKASDIIAPVWPLKNFIAVNPLQGLEDQPFEEAVRESARYRKIQDSGNQRHLNVNRELIKWCSAYFDEGQATLAIPGRQAGFYRCFADLANFDSKLSQSSADRVFLKGLPVSSAEALSLCLDKLKIPERKRVAFLRQSLAALPGWSGYVKWKSNWQSPLEASRCPATLVDYLAVRMVLTCILFPNAAVAQVKDIPEPAFLEQLSSIEKRYRESLLGKLLPQAAKVGEKSTSRAKAQLVFCIDVRSEPFRRAIESRNDYETFGFAGFFGVPVRVKGFGEEKAYDSCPVLLKPGHEVEEGPCCSHAHKAEKHGRGRSLIKHAKSFYQSLKYNFATPFALVEMLGPFSGLWMTAKTFAPSAASKLQSDAVGRILPVVDVAPTLDGISDSRQADFGEQALRMMGLTSGFAPLVVLCGHGSTTQNNAFASGLDCGACGGNHGGANARILAAILNSKAVRALLGERGLEIPEDTLFLGAEHDTTTDEMQLFGIHALTYEHTEKVEELRADLAAARAANATARCRTFGADTADTQNGIGVAFERSRDWAQVRPEWGLARNAAFIVGPRELTRLVDLEGRCFLHSYDWQSDTAGKYLTTILTAPMVVAQWINSQYLFSTIDPVAFGAGSKVTQNVAGKIGVMQGNASDLMHGLPYQSVYAADGQPYHEPQRLLTVVYAPKSKLDPIIRGQDVLRKLFENEWVRMACIEPTDQKSYFLTKDLKWQELDQDHRDICEFVNI